MYRNIRILGLLFCVFYLISCDKEEIYIQKFETYFDNENFIRDGLIAYYPFNGDVLDYSGNNFNGIANNVDFSKDRFGNIKRACKLSGLDSYVNIPNNQYLNKGDYTICFWYRADTLNDEIERAILSKTDTLEGYAITTYRSDNYSYNIFRKTMLYNGDLAYSGSKLLGSSSSYWSANEPEKFIFTAISFNDTLFIDHNSGEHTAETFNVPLTFIDNDFDLIIGKSNLPNLSNAKGEIDDLLIYNRILDYEEVLNLSEWTE